MVHDARIQTLLGRSGAFVFSSNLPYAVNLEQAGGRAVQQPSGHLVFYGQHGRRVLYADPDGQPLHECEWEPAEGGSIRLQRARVWLDWGQWVGLLPSGLVTSTTLDLSRKPGWQRIHPDALRQMAAQALQVPLSEIQFFYTDDDLRIDTRGLATIRHRKDAFYLLEEGRFDGAHFMACMGAMHWDRIDFLPVVELFQSLVPGTGSAVLELIRELYDDQCPTGDRLLRYRGIPTYPSEAAYKLFSGFFTAQETQEADPFASFMDPPRSHEVTWRPHPRPLRRYYDLSHHLCVTVREMQVVKATLADDPSGLSYMMPDAKGFAPGGRGLQVETGELILKDGTHEMRLSWPSSWGTIKDSTVPLKSVAGPGWRDLFVEGVPPVSPVEAFGAVLLYPEDEREIDEMGTQAFVVDYLTDLLEQETSLRMMIDRAKTVLIHNMDAGLTSLLSMGRANNALVLFRHPAHIQRQAQSLCTHRAREGRSAELASIRLYPAEPHLDRAYQGKYDLIYDAVPVAQYDQPDELFRSLSRFATALAPRGLAFLLGPQMPEDRLRGVGLRVAGQWKVAEMPSFRMHQSILTKARIKAGLTLYLLGQG
ncbi:MAG: hypothetical protein NW703_04920 [Nitrospiraceae bacterium]